MLPELRRSIVELECDPNEGLKFEDDGDDEDDEVRGASIAILYYTIAIPYTIPYIYTLHAWRRFAQCLGWLRPGSSWLCTCTWCSH